MQGSGLQPHPQRGERVAKEALNLRGGPVLLSVGQRPQYGAGVAAALGFDLPGYVAAGRGGLPPAALAVLIAVSRA